MMNQQGNKNLFAIGIFPLEFIITHMIEKFRNFIEMKVNYSSHKSYSFHTVNFTQIQSVSPYIIPLRYI